MPATVASVSSANGTSGYTVARPSGVAAGDLLIGVVASDWNTLANNALPSGTWTAISTSDYDGGSNQMHVGLWYRVATGSETSTYSVSVGGGADSAAAIIRVTDWDDAGSAADAISQVAPTAVSAGSGACNAPSLTPQGSDDLLLCFHAVDGANGGGTISYTPPTGMTEVVDRQSSTWTRLAVAYLESPPSPSGTKTFTTSPTNHGKGAGCTISIKSASAAAPPVTGIAAGTQAGNTASAVGRLRNIAVAAAAQAAQLASAAGKLGYTISAAATQANSTAAASGHLGHTGTGAASQADATSEAAAQLGYTATGDTSQDPDAATASGGLTYTGAVSAVQDDNVPDRSVHLDAGGLDVSLLAAYNFDEASGDVLDVTGNGHGFPLRSGMARETGHTGSGLSSTNGSVEGPAIFGQTAQRTVMFWLKSGTTFNGWIFEWHSSDADSGRWGLLCLSGNMGFRGTPAAGGSAQHAAITRPSDNEFHHWAGTFDGSVVRLYVDGVLRATTSVLSGGLASDADVLMWHDTVSGTQVVDDLRVFDQALDLATIQDLMNTPVTEAPTGSEGEAAPTQANQAGSATGRLSYTGSAAPAHAAQTASAAGHLAHEGATAATQAGDIGAAEAEVVYEATAAATQASDTGSAAGSVTYSGTVTPNQAGNTGAASGHLAYTATADTDQAGDTSDADGVVTAFGFTGSAAATQASQIGAAAGHLTYTGTAAPTASSDSGAADGEVVAFGFAGSAQAQQASQAPTASGHLQYTGAAGNAQGGDTAAATGTVQINPTGSVTAAQASQTGAAAGVTFIPITGLITATQADNIAFTIGLVFVPITGTAQPAQSDQSGAAVAINFGQMTERLNEGTTERLLEGATTRPFAGLTPRL